ncbi:hypothetical protein KNHN1_02930 [Pseudomonas guariconensis]
MDWGAVRFWVGVPEVYDVIAISPHTMQGVPQAGTVLLSWPQFVCRGFANYNAKVVPEIERPFKKNQKRRRVRAVRAFPSDL